MTFRPAPLLAVIVSVRTARLHNPPSLIPLLARSGIFSFANTKSSAKFLFVSTRLPSNGSRRLYVSQCLQTLHFPSSRSVPAHFATRTHHCAYRFSFFPLTECSHHQLRKHACRSLYCQISLGASILMSPDTASTRPPTLRSADEN